MSRHHAAHAGDVTHIVDHINNISHEEAEKIYGIEFREGESIYDPIYHMVFDSVPEWAEYNVTQDELEYEEDINTFRTDNPHYS